MFAKILIANRGEIACRVIKTAKRMGINTVAVYSDADRRALHVKLADEAVHIGAAPSRESYLVGERIIQAALRTDAQAIHPGYGFLSENAEFAQICAEKNLVFIGPPVSAIKAMGSKSAAKNIMSKAGVPLVPGYHGDDQNPALLKQSADKMGYPVLLKAVAGGGGKGMRQVWNANEFDQGLADAKRESLASFGNDDMLVEKYLTQPRHVEVQVFCDSQGNGVYLFERDCSVQRRHQKVIEEAPAPNMPDGLREKMGKAAVRAAQAIHYEGAGTVEFLLDRDGAFYFMEMNTRLQVEHPVTELITGQDLVEWQLRVANGERLPLTQNELVINGHAFEARIYAEDPNHDFLPTTGTLNHLSPPTENQHVRVDTGVTQGDEVSPFYDPMIAKLITWGSDRNTALVRLTRALRDYQISGVTTNIPFLINLTTSTPFISANLDTGFIEKYQNLLLGNPVSDILAYLPLVGLYLTLKQQEHSGYSPWHHYDGWRLNQTTEQHHNITVDGTAYSIRVEHLDSGHYQISTSSHSIVATGTLAADDLIATIDGYQQTINIAQQAKDITLFTKQGAVTFSLAQPDLGDSADKSSGDNFNTAFNAPMNGTIVEVLVETNTAVKAGDALLIMEAMKMQHTISTPRDGMVNEFFFTAGDLVNGGTVLLDFKANNE